MPENLVSEEACLSGFRVERFVRYHRFGGMYKALFAFREGGDVDGPGG